jgi:hypothetical protein
MFSDIAFMPLRDKFAVAAVLALLLGGFGWVFSLHSLAIRAAPTIDDHKFYSGLPADAVAANAAFLARIRSAFPLQTPEAAMTRVLASQGFQSDGWFGKRMTFRRLPGPARNACDFTASVAWVADEEARIKALDGRFLRTPECADPFAR